MRIGTRAVLAVITLCAALLVGVTGPSAYAATSLARQPATASKCHYNGLRMTSITAAGPRVREQSWFRTHHRRQRVHYQASLQTLLGRKWSTAKSTTQKRSPLLNATTTTMPKLTLAVPLSKASRYRVVTVIRWVGRSGSVVATQRMRLARYNGGRSSCVAYKSPRPTSAPVLSVTASAGTVPVGTAVSGSFTVSGMNGAGTAYVNLMGPAECDTCTFDSVQGFQVPVSGNGTYSLPTAVLSSSRVWRWDVYLSNSAGAGQASSALMYAQETVGYSVTTGTNDPSLNRSLSAGAIQERLQFNGFHYGTQVNWNATLWGPYSTQTEADQSACGTGAADSKHLTFAGGTPVIGPGGATIALSQSPGSMNNGQPAFWRVSVAANVMAPYTQTEAVPAKVCSATFHTQK